MKKCGIAFKNKGAEEAMFEGKIKGVPSLGKITLDSLGYNEMEISAYLKKNEKVLHGLYYPSNVVPSPSPAITHVASCPLPLSRDLRFLPRPSTASSVS